MGAGRGWGGEKPGDAGVKLMPHPGCSELPHVLGVCRDSSVSGGVS